MNPILFAIWLSLARLGTFLYLKLGVYAVWSKAYQSIHERKHKDVQIRTYKSLTELAFRIGTQFKWRADGWMELWDAVSSAQKVEATMTEDCDGAGIYISTAINKSIEAGLMQGDGIKEASFFTVTWMELGGRPSGHNVALIEYTDGQFAYMDYRMPSKKFKTIDEVAKLVRDSYSGWTTGDHGKVPCVGLVWAVADTNLRLKQIKRG